ncbi:SDR family NAD(P)-dependent oxidoreductase [Brachybacterium saurashtrense]|uniref:SDR family NAD(P)-dependent oxidoreductase n=1 Tax=Brachybacterium saurashtrense TaxID=556288 RepID=A0A345YMF5_9MICO|nr:SDR family oxidoreductase [Brachybacterium saurashtrense]AXK45107.1 SDR family NAD(P)-dependent oxidoreductase [Brachybacterium saurashtrense]RRR22140.1 SDR family NAD(P)-dependent oxidoreductase [Brachybacterium saurashtrense]
MRNRLALITGGTRGIGRATSLRLAQDGWDLVLGYARDEHAATATKSAAEALGVECSTVRADLTTDAGIDELFDAASSQMGRLDAVVNNVGATLQISGLAETPPQTIRRVIDLNLTSAILVARRAVQQLGSGGVLVNVSSGAATTGAPGEYVHYAAAKAGVDALTKGLAIEVAPRGIRVVGVAPGTVDTQVHADAGDPGRPERVARTHPMGRVGRPEEIASVIAFALSADAGYVTGTTIRAAGGV